MLVYSEACFFSQIERSTFEPIRCGLVRELYERHAARRSAVAPVAGILPVSITLITRRSMAHRTIFAAIPTKNNLRLPGRFQAPPTYSL